MTYQSQIAKAVKGACILGVASISLMLAGCSEPVEVDKKSTLTGNMIMDTPTLTMPGLDRQRQIRIYLPPSYQQSQQRYPVIYLHDGQNLFDDATSYAGEWQVDEALEALAQQGQQFIAVGIDNGGEKRLDEMSPWKHEKYGGGEGEQYINFIVDTVKPYIDQTYRTETAPEHTAIIGSSMGGLISHYAIYQHPDVFGKAGVLSPSYWFSDEVYGFTKDNQLNGDHKIYFAIGELEGDDMVGGMNRMVQQIRASQPLPKIESKVVANAKHNEAFWRNEFSSVITYLFAK